jgi:hypothetical protein
MNIFDIFDIFIYSKDIREKIVTTYVSNHYKETGPFDLDLVVKEYKLKISAKRLQELSFPELNTGKSIFYCWP